ncbi:MAG: efflux RND transporter permease subunit [Bacteroidota bacterium]
MKYNFREFPLSSWAIDNRITIFLLTLIIVFGGLATYRSLPKENFPEIQWPVIYVSVPYPGTSPEDVEILINQEIENELQSIKGIKEITSVAIQDYGSVFVEFETDVDLKEAKRNVQESVDKAKPDLPSDLPSDPSVMDINFSEIPIMFINISGNYDKVALKAFAEDLQDELEDIREILRVDIVGALEQEVQVNVDLYKMQAASIAFQDIENTIAGENIIISGGELDIEDQQVAIRVNGEFERVEQIRNLLVKGGKGNSVYLHEIAEVVDGFEDQESFARLDGEPVITLNVVKKAGRNLIAASDKVKERIEELKATRYPERLTLTVSANQADSIENTLNELINTIIIGFILVTLVLLFFMGVRDALFVGLAVPLSSFMAFMLLPALGFTMNLVVLFAFILAMGIVVDNAIVVIENTYRIFNEEGLPIVPAAKKAAGEVIGPVFAGTLTTLAPFLPLMFWEGTIGEFMYFLPVTMIVTLSASLLVAYVINPVFAVQFMTRDSENAKTNHRSVLLYTGIAVVLGLLGHLLGSALIGNILFFVAVFILLNAYLLRHVVKWFQDNIITGLKNGYRGILRWCIQGKRPVWVVLATFLLLIVSVGLFVGGNLKIVLFPQADPNFVYVYNELPVGTDVAVTDSVTRILEDRVMEVIGEDNPNVKAFITNIAIGAGDANSFDQGGAKSNKGKITVEFVQFKYRTGDISSREYLEKIRENVKGIPGAKVTVDQEQGGPPQDPPVQVQLFSDNFDDLMSTSKAMLTYLDSINIPGVEELKWDADAEKQEILVNVDRVKASQIGISSGQVGMAIRTAVFGKEASRFRPENTDDDYPINIRLDQKYRDDLNALMNMNISFRDIASGQFLSVPISAVADIEYSSAYGSINRTDLDKSVKITSNILDGYDVNAINQEVTYWVEQFKQRNAFSPEVRVEIGGESEEQQEQAAFLGMALWISLVIIFIVLVTQFNSLINVLIILSQVILSIIGVLLGYFITQMEVSVIMTGVGIVALAGIVVNNGIILVDFIDMLRKQGESLKDAVIDGGAVRFTPVLLTASSTILGLVPLAISMNINFETLFTKGDPQIFFGGDSAAFWGPLSWTIIYGLTFATVITLLVVPLMYYIAHRIGEKTAHLFERKESMDYSEDELQKFADPDFESETLYPTGSPTNGNGNGNGKKTDESLEEQGQG